MIVTLENVESTGVVTGWRDQVWRILRDQVGVTGWIDPVWRMLRAQVGVTGW